MNHQYDFDEQLISERVPVIQIPNFAPLISSRRKTVELSNQTIKNIELYLQESKNKQIQKVKELQAKQKYIGEEVSKQQQKKQQKIKQIEEKEKEKILKECTFKPNINKRGSRRALDQFLDDQNEHIKKVEAKKRNLKMAIENQKQFQTFRPKINPNTSNSRRNVAPVHQRLYALKDKQNIPQNIVQLNVENTFHPSISKKSKKMARQTPIDQLLYGDALRRQEKSKDMMQTQQQTDLARPQKTVNYTNEKYAAQRFIREYFGVLERLEINLSIHYKIDYIMFNQILKSMGFIKEDQESQDGISVNQRGLVYDAYSLIEKYGVNARNVCVFLLGLIGIYHINPINFEEGEEAATEKEFNLEEGEGRKIQKHFDVLFRNRLNCENFKKTTEKTTEQATFHPKINKNSEQLAQKYRSQMLEEANQLLENYPQLQYSIPQDGIISHTDLLVLHRMAKEIQRKKTKQENENKNLEECTFKPTTLSSMQQTLKNSGVSNFDSKLGEKKSFELYNYYKSLQSKKESLRVSRQVDDAQCTFAPNLKKDKVSSATPYAKHIDQTLYRMHKGRQEKQQKDKFLTRGEKQPNNNQPMGKSRMTNQQSIKNSSRRRYNQQDTQQDDQNTPTLMLDVNLGDKTDRIVLYRGDQDHLHEVAEEFARKHNLDEENKEQLLELLEVELNNVLEKIDEDEGDEYDGEN